MKVESRFFTDLPVAACVVQTGRVTRVNRRFLSLTGNSAAELGGRRRRRPGPPDGQGPNRFGRAVVRGRLRGAGTWRPGPLGGFRARRAGGQARYEDLLQNINDIVHLHAVEDGRLPYINPAFTRLFGYRVEDWLGRSVRDLVAPRLAHLYDDYARKVVERGHHQGIMCLVDVYGRERYVEYHDILQREGGRTVVRGIAQEVTERVARAKSLERMLDGITLAMADVVEQRDPYTSGHQRRVAEIAVTVAQQMGLPDDRLRPLYIAASLHDIGKIAIPTEILAKPAALTDLERKLIELHPQAGTDILRRVPFPWNVAGITLSHHERLNGSGYPRGPKGGEIDLESRILAVADVYEAMTTHRPYRPALATETAMAELSPKSGILYDGKVVQVLADMIG